MWTRQRFAVQQGCGAELLSAGATHNMPLHGPAGRRASGCAAQHRPARGRGIWHRRRAAKATTIAEVEAEAARVCGSVVAGGAAARGRLDLVCIDRKSVV